MQASGSTLVHCLFMPYALLLDSVARYISLTEAEAAFFNAQITVRKFRKGQFLVHEGAVDRSAYFVNQGSARAYYVDRDGHEHTIQLAVEGWWIGDLQSFILQQPALLNVEALEDSQILEIPNEKLQRLYEQVPKFERYFRILTQRAFAAFQQRMLQNLSMSAEERYLAFQAQYSKLELRLPQKLIASYLGMSPEFLSKIKKRIFLKESR
jgi:CRP-like cAMP-binding protein